MEERARAFPVTGEHAKALGYDIEEIFRAWMTQLTGKEGEQLEELIQDGVENPMAPHEDGSQEGATWEEAAAQHEELTATELRHLELYAAGNTGGDISRLLVCSLETTKSHAKRIRSKLLAKNMTHAVDQAHRRGIL